MKWFKLLILFLSLNLFAQEGLHIIENKKTVIPFKLINNLIFIPININGVELTFLLDSGVNETILFSLENKEIRFEDIQKMKFSGLGGTVEIEGLKAVKNKVKIGNNFADDNHIIYLILDEEFNFSSHVGIPVNGIMGYQLFKNHPVKIDYITKKITIYPNQNISKEIRWYEEFPISIEINKPYLMADVEQLNQKAASKMLIDIGNSDAVWLFPSLIPGFVYNRPNIDDYLGRGFNGDIYGKRSRIHNLYIGSFKIEKPLTAMPDEFSIQHLNLVSGRKGSIGSETLRRFTVIFNYPEQKIYLRKNRDFKDPFHINMSGLDVKHDGMFWDQDLVQVENEKKSKASNTNEVYSSTAAFQYKFTLKPAYSVAGIRKDSPAFEAGIKKDDKIIKINSKKAADLTLEQINQLLKSEEGKLIKMELERNSKLLKFEFYLVDPIPYQEN